MFEQIPSYLPYIQFFGQMALIAGAAFAGTQFLLHRRELAEKGSLEVLTRLQSPEFREAYTHVWRLPLDASAQEVRAAGADMEAAVDCVAMTFETLGVMVHNRMVDIELVDQAIGGFLRESWRRTHNYIADQREQIGSKRVAEWYQWLAEHLAVETRRSAGAYDAYKRWKP